MRDMGQILNFQSKKEKKKSRDADVELVDQSQSRVYLRNLQSVFFLWDHHGYDNQKKDPRLSALVYRCAVVDSIIWDALHPPEEGRVLSLPLSQTCVHVSSRHGPSSFCLLFVFVCFQMSVNNFYSWKTWCVVFLCWNIYISEEIKQWVKSF